MQFKAKTLTKSRRFLRMALMGVTGGGKTYTALTIARTLTDGKILIIDTERSSAGLYAEELNADGRIEVVDDLQDYSPTTYTRCLEWAASQHYALVIIDSLSHAWQGTKDEVDKVAKRSQSGSSWAAWRDVTPQHNGLVDAMLKYPGHVIATLRVKTEWITEKDSNGKSVPKKVGLQPEQKDGIEYEFDFAASMDESNNFIVTKTRAVQFRGAVVHQPGSAFAETLRAWCEAGIEEDGTVRVTDARQAVKNFALNNQQNDRLRDLAANKGYKGGEVWKDIVLAAWNKGHRGESGLEEYINELPPPIVSGAPVTPPVTGGQSETVADDQRPKVPAATEPVEEKKAGAPIPETQKPARLPVDKWGTDRVKFYDQVSAQDWNTGEGDTFEVRMLKLVSLLLKIKEPATLDALQPKQWKALTATMDSIRLGDAPAPDLVKEWV